MHQYLSPFDLLPLSSYVSQVTLAERLSHGCPDCKAVFATKVSLQKHKLWNHPIETKAEPKLHKTPVKGTARKR